MRITIREVPVIIGMFPPLGVTINRVADRLRMESMGVGWKFDNGFSLATAWPIGTGDHGGRVFWCSHGPAAESGEGYMGNVRWSLLSADTWGVKLPNILVLRRSVG